MPLYIRDLGTLSLLSHSSDHTDTEILHRDGTRHLGPMALLLHYRHHLAQLRQSFHTVRSLHVVLRLVHYSPGPHLLVSRQCPL